MCSCVRVCWQCAQVVCLHKCGVWYYNTQRIFCLMCGTTPVFFGHTPHLHTPTNRWIEKCFKICYWRYCSDIPLHIIVLVYFPLTNKPEVVQLLCVAKLCCQLWQQFLYSFLWSLRKLEIVQSCYELWQWFNLNIACLGVLFDPVSIHEWGGGLSSHLPQALLGEKIEPCVHHLSRLWKFVLPA